MESSNSVNQNHSTYDKSADRSVSKTRTKTISTYQGSNHNNASVNHKNPENFNILYRYKILSITIKIYKAKSV